jgi:hypothetical protein
MAKQIKLGTPPLKWSKLDETIRDIETNFQEVFLSIGGEGVSLENLTSTVAPATNNIYDLGTVERGWKNLFLSGTTIRLGTASITNVGNTINLPAGALLNGVPISDVAGQDGPTGPVGPVGPAGPQGLQGATGPTGPQGLQGVPGTDGLGILDVEIVDGDLVVIYDDSTTVNAGTVQGPQGIQGETGLTGPTGPQGNTGPTGPQGSDGTSIVLKGAVPTVGDLPLEGNEVGDLYVVTESGDGYVWDGVTWQNAGPIRGPQGEIGPTGPEGTPGTPGSTGPTGPTGPSGLAIAFSNIAVPGQDLIIAESESDTLTIVAGTNVSISTNATTDTLTINASGDGTVNLGTATQLAFYPSSAAAVSSAGAGLTWTSATSTLNATNINAQTIQSSSVGVPTFESATDIVFAPVGEVRVSSKIISEVATPTQNNHAANKTYVDTRALTLGSTTITLNTSVNTITGMSSITSDTFVGALTGNASSASIASTVSLTATSLTNATHYITFVDTATGNENIRTDIDLFYNPSTNVLTAGIFSGSGSGLSGIPNSSLNNSSITFGTTNIALGGTSSTLAGLTSVTATTFVGSLNGNANTASTASVATTVTLTDTTNSSIFQVTNSGSSAYIINQTSNPTLNLLRGVTYQFNIDASGHPFWIKTALVTGTGSAYSTGVTNNGTAVGTVTFTVPLDAPNTLYYICQFHSSMAGQINISNASIDDGHYLLFTNSLTGNQNVRTDSGISYNPSTNTISAATFSGSLSGNAATATVADKATTVTLLATNTTNAVHYVTFVDSATGDEQIRTDTDMTYNPNTGILSAPTFFGSLDGNAQTASTASVANTVALTQTDNPVSGTYYPTFVLNASGNEIVRTDIGLSYNPTTNALTTTTFVGSLNGNANTATTAGTVTTAAQPTITSLGSLTGLTVAGTTSVQQILEKATIVATAIPNNAFIDILTGSVVYYTVNADSNWSLNFRGNSGTLLNSLMSTGQSLTVAVMVTNGATSYYPLDHIIDGTSVPVKWQNGITVTAGNVNGIDIYSYTIIKTANNTYTVFGSQTKFA